MQLEEKGMGAGMGGRRDAKHGLGGRGPRTCSTKPGGLASPGARPSRSTMMWVGVGMLLRDSMRYTCVRVWVCLCVWGGGMCWGVGVVEFFGG